MVALKVESAHPDSVVEPIVAGAVTRPLITIVALSPGEKPVPSTEKEWRGPGTPGMQITLGRCVTRNESSGGTSAQAELVKATEVPGDAS